MHRYHFYDLKVHFDPVYHFWLNVPFWVKCTILGLPASDVHHWSLMMPQSALFMGFGKMKANLD